LAKETDGKLDVLVNNAGGVNAMGTRRSLTLNILKCF